NYPQCPWNRTDKRLASVANMQRETQFVVVHRDFPWAEAVLCIVQGIVAQSIDSFIKSSMEVILDSAKH
ncbi:MAG: hypothetical protein ACR2PI_06275, partial [Hyphomicrobiaceae bacterium]